MLFLNWHINVKEEASSTYNTSFIPHNIPNKINIIAHILKMYDKL